MTDVFIQAAESKETVTYLNLVATTVLAYDYVLIIGDEVRLIWSAPMSLGKSLYFLTRYPVVADVSLVLYHQFAILSPAECDRVYKAIGYLLGIGTLVAESILVMRTWVIWSRRPLIGAALLGGLALCWIPVFYLLAESLNSLRFVTPPEPDLPGCYLHSQKTILFVVFLIITAFETVILALTLVRFAPLWRRKKTALIKTIYRDGIFNYVYLCVLSICNVMVLLTAPRGYTTLLSALQRVMHSILSSRVLLHLRQAATAPSMIDATGVSSSVYEHDMDPSRALFHTWTDIFITEQIQTADFDLPDIHPS